MLVRGLSIAIVKVKPHWHPGALIFVGFESSSRFSALQ